MDNLLRRSRSRVVLWIRSHYLSLAVLLSLLHIGLSCIHVRDSGGADPLAGAKRPHVVSSRSTA